MNVDAERVMKLDRCMAVEFQGKDKHGDTVFVKLRGDSAADVLRYLQSGIACGEGNKTNLVLSK